MNRSAFMCRSLVVDFTCTRMASTNTSYEEAVRKLNSLQSNKSTIEQIRRDKKVGQKCTNIEDMENYLLRTGVSLNKLDELSVIHIAGTKGKGSTSAMCESILRHHGFKTGFYSSPHLVAVRERIRLDGKPVSKEMFAKRFHRVYDMLDGSKAFEGDMPKYFAFLTVLAYNVFLEERVDVAVVEVGIGGTVDYTNVLRKVPVVGITALGLDHTSILGHTLPQIARAKAGVMKPGCEAYTVDQSEHAMQVLKEVARDVKCKLNIVPEFEEYGVASQSVLPVDLTAYRTNASLALQLAHSWIRTKKPLQKMTKQIGKQRPEINTVIVDHSKVLDLVCDVPVETLLGLKNCKWPGRYQLLESEYATFFLDGAHTKESMEICARWFEDKTRDHDKILIFSATGDRDAEVLLRPLMNIGFKSIFFVIPTAYKDISTKNDNFSLMEHNELVARCNKHAELWNRFHEGNNSSKISVMECVSDALINIKRNSAGRKKSVLITGSLHLVGASLSIIDPNLSRD